LAFESFDKAEKPYEEDDDRGNVDYLRHYGSCDSNGLNQRAYLVCRKSERKEQRYDVSDGKHDESRYYHGPGSKGSCYLGNPHCIIYDSGFQNELNN